MLGDAGMADFVAWWGGLRVREAGQGREEACRGSRRRVAAVLNFNERTGNVYENKGQGQKVEQPASADLQARNADASLRSA